MTWLGWRQQRAETLIAAAALALLAAVAIPIGVHAASVYAQEHLSACAGDSLPASCRDAVGTFLSRFDVVNVLLTWSTLLPPLGALLLAAPFVLDLESGICRLAWTQSVTRRRWIGGKLAMGAAGAVLVALLLTVLATWTRAPLDHLNGRMSPNTYDAEGLIPIGYALLAFGVAVALGALWRRTVPAVLVAFVAYVVTRAAMDSWLRERLLTPVTQTWRFGSATGAGAAAVRHGLVLDEFVSDASGRALAGGSGIVCTHPTPVTAHCAPRAHAFLTTVYQPPGRFWELQSIEFAIVAGAGALLILLAAWWTLRRDA